MLVLPNSPECAALRADMKEDRLNSRFQHTHKNKSIKAHGIMAGRSVIVQDESLFRQILINGNRMSTVISLC